MRSLWGLVMFILVAGFGASGVSAQMMSDRNPMVGGAAMFKTKTIVENAVNSKDHTTLVAAVQAAGLVDTLKSAGPFTVFAPVNSAFDALPAGTVDTLLKPENKGKLVRSLPITWSQEIWIRRRSQRPSKQAAARQRLRPSRAANCGPRWMAKRSS